MATCRTETGRRDIFALFPLWTLIFSVLSSATVLFLISSGSCFSCFFLAALKVKGTWVHALLIAIVLLLESTSKPAYSKPEFWLK